MLAKLYQAKVCEAEKPFHLTTLVFYPMSADFVVVMLHVAVFGCIQGDFLSHHVSLGLGNSFINQGNPFINRGNGDVLYLWWMAFS